MSHTQISYEYASNSNNKAYIHYAIIQTSEIQQFVYKVYYQVA